MPGAGLVCVRLRARRSECQRRLTTLLSHKQRDSKSLWPPQLPLLRFGLLQDGPVGSAPLSHTTQPESMSYVAGSRHLQSCAEGRLKE
jgi:hypothetical protein